LSKIAGFERFFLPKLKQNGFPTPYICVWGIGSP
jgi:hypothetical protein